MLVLAYGEEVALYLNALVTATAIVGAYIVGLGSKFLGDQSIGTITVFEWIIGIFKTEHANELADLDAEFGIFLPFHPEVLHVEGSIGELHLNEVVEVLEDGTAHVETHVLLFEAVTIVCSFLAAVIIARHIITTHFWSSGEVGHSASIFVFHLSVGTLHAAFDGLVDGSTEESGFVGLFGGELWFDGLVLGGISVVCFCKAGKSEQRGNSEGQCLFHFGVGIKGDKCQDVFR